MQNERYRSKFEDKFASELKQHGVVFEYEAVSLNYLKTIQSGFCKKCETKTVFQRCSYTPDFFLPVQNIFIETKGRWTGEDRKKHLAVREANPTVDIRLVFMSNNKIHKKSDTRYGDWADKHGFLWSVRSMPDAWLHSPEPKEWVG